MTINEYQKLAMTTLNKDLTEKEVLINGVMGLCGESGEVIDLDAYTGGYNLQIAFSTGYLAGKSAAEIE